MRVHPDIVKKMLEQGAVLGPVADTRQLVPWTGRMELFIPGLTVKSEANQREHWAAKAKRAAGQRELIAAWLFGRDCPKADRRVKVVLTRIYSGQQKPMDEGDNLNGSFKATRDGVAKWMGRDDGLSSGVEWFYAQVRGDKAGVLLRIEELP